MFKYLFFILALILFVPQAHAVQTKAAGDKVLAEKCTGESFTFLGPTEDGKLLYLNCSLKRLVFYSCKDADREAKKNEGHITSVKKGKRYQLALRALELRKSYRKFCAN